MDSIRQPIGPFSYDVSFDAEALQRQIQDIGALPNQLKEIAAGVSAASWAQSYREGGWTAFELLQHMVDSHTHALLRTKWTLTEDQPMIKPYEENDWVKTADCKTATVEEALQWLTLVHARWHRLLLTLTREQWERTYIHPQYQREVPLWQLAALYSWHGRHHAAQMEIALGH